MKNTVYRSAQDLDDPNIDGIVGLISHSNKPEQNFKYLKQAYKYISTSAKNRKTKHSMAVTDEIRKYIEESYMLPNLNLSMAAMRFNFSEGYFSYFFKEYIGISFTEYVEQVRIQKATTLLKESQLAIDEIAILTGYNSAQSFRRAFKRVTGVSPAFQRTRKS